MTKEQETKNRDKSIHISDEVIASISAIALEDVAGVIGIAGTGKPNAKLSKSVKPDIKDGGILVDVDITVEYGVNIPEVAWEVQRKIKKAVESMTGLAVHKVNVNVKDVRLDDAAEAQSAAEEDESEA